MQNLTKAQLAAAVVAALGLSLHGAPSIAADADAAKGASEAKTEKADKGEMKATKHEHKHKAGKEGSCKGKEGSCKGKEGSCKGKEGSCKSAK